MKIAATIAYLATALVAFSDAQNVGTNMPEVLPSLPSQTCTAAGCTTQNTKIVVDANWRWTHNVGGYNNCYTGNTWNSNYCPDPVTCSTNCAIDGADYAGTYGVTTSNGQVNLRLVTHGPYSTNIGSRLYLLEDDSNYKMYKLLNQEFTFDVDVSQLPWAGAAYGTGYCDAQCPHDIKFINGEANINNWTPSTSDPNSGTGQYGSCCPEMDIWESNCISQAYTSHPCTVTGQTRCSTPTECGDDATGHSFDGVCDKDGCDFNPWRMNNHTLYGPGSSFAVDSTQPITVVTQFITDDGTANGNLVEIKRFYVQNGKAIDNAPINWSGIDSLNYLNDNKGGLKALGDALKRGMVLTMSFWTDHAAQCLWLDSSYPTTKDPSVPGVNRGSCPTTSGVSADVQAQYPSATVKYGNIRVGDLGTTTGSTTPVTTSPTTAPTTTKATTAPTTSSSPTTTKATTAPTTSSSPVTTKATPAPTTSTSAPTTTASSGGVGATTAPRRASLATHATTTRNGTLNASPTKSEFAT
ncbi:hypothetical protein AC1031_010960 [Aphanomyces cochlioides]|nr:hypothetical protein AC1031_010960 [Aphanomyces cochlioides]